MTVKNLKIKSKSEILVDINNALETLSSGALADIYNKLCPSVVQAITGIGFQVLPEYSDEFKDRIAEDGWQVVVCEEYDDLWDWIGPNGEACEYSFSTETEAWHDMVSNCNLLELYAN